MSKPTPGPWSCVLDDVGTDPELYVVSPQEDVVARLGRLSARKTNAALIAAAPDLLDALSAIFNQAHPRADYAGQKATHYIVDKDLVDAARAAIAKATNGGDR